MNRLVDGVGGVAGGVVDVRHRMARGAGDAGLGRRVIVNVIVRIVERAAEERHHVMTARAPARSLHIPVALHAHLARFLHAEEVDRVVERAEMMRAVEPALVGVLVALHTIVVHHHRARRDEVAARRAHLRRMEIFLTFLRADLVLLRMRGVEHHAAKDQRRHRSAPPQADGPLDSRTGHPVDDVEPDGENWRDDVRPIDRLAQHRILDAEEIKAHQRHAGEEQRQADEEQQIAHAHRATVRPVVGVLDVDRAEDDHRQHHQQPEHEMPAEHDHVEIVLVGRVRVALEPFEEGDGTEVNRVRAENGEQAEDGVEQPAQARSHGADVLLSLRLIRRNVFGAHAWSAMALEGLSECPVKGLSYSTHRRRPAPWGELLVFRGDLLNPKHQPQTSKPKHHQFTSRQPLERCA